MLTVRLGLIALLATALVPVCHAASVVTDADSYVRDGAYASTNYGTSTGLAVKSSTSAGYNRQAYFKFDLSTISGTVSSALLEVNAKLTASGTLPLEVCAVPNTSWGESTITWNNRPPLGNAIAPLSVTGTSATWYTVDVTAYVNSVLASGVKVVSLGIEGTSTTDSQVAFVASRETTNGAKLVITTSTVTSAPSAPTNLTATAASTSQINLAWTDNSGGVASFYVERSADNVTFSQIASVGTGVTSYSDKSLPASTTYYYRVRAYDSGGTSAYSNVANATTQSTVTTTPVPSAPTNLAATAASTSQINLAWVDNTGGIASYYIERSVDNVSFSQIASVGIGVTSYSDKSLPASTTYYYRVRAYDSGGTSAYSNVASATTQSTVTTTSGATYYVSTTGSDSNPGTLASPWRTIKHALSSIMPGQTLYVRGGTYIEDVTGISIHPGTSTSPILVSAYPGERPVVQGLLWLTNPSYWTINGLNVTWNSATDTASEHMIKMTNGVGWTYENSEIWGAHSFACMLVAGTVLGQPANWRVAYNCIHDTYPSNQTNQDHLIYANTGNGAGAGLIERNILYNATNGEAVKLAGPTTGSGTANVVVRYNTMYNTSQTMLVGGTSANNQIYRNIMYGCNTGNANIRGYQLTGTGNVAYDNAAGGSAAYIKNDTSPGVQDLGGDLYPVNPLFNSISPWALSPLNTACADYGVYAP